MNTEAWNDMDLALLRGFKLGVTNIGRVEHSTDLLRRKNGLSGTYDGVRLIPLGDYVTDPVRNPLHELTRRENYRLGDMNLDSRSLDMNLQMRGR